MKQTFTCYWYMALGPRESQEDCLLIGDTIVQSDNVSGQQELAAPLTVAVCDGMGGLADGEDVSRFMCEGIKRRIQNSGMKQMRVELEGLQAQSKSESVLSPASGTTVTGIYIDGTDLTIFNAGDSRVYQVHCGKAMRLSKDHSMVQDMIDSGVLEEEDAMSHPYRHVVTFGMGPAFDVWDPDTLGITTASLAPTDHLILCSDGLSDVLTDAEIEAVFADNVDPGEALALAVNGKGLRDNTSFIVLTMNQNLTENG